MDTNLSPDPEIARAATVRWRDAGPGWTAKHRGPLARLASRLRPGRGDDDLAERSGFAWRGLVEAAVLIGLCLAADRAFGDGRRFLGVEPHPFGLAVLLAAAQYGTAEGAAAALLACVALFAFNLPQQAFDEDHYAWLRGVIRDPLLWFGTSLLIGEIAGRARERARQAATTADRREIELAGMVQANADLAARAAVLEARIAGQQRTVTAIYEAARSMGPGREAVLRGALALVRAAVGATRCSIYLSDGRALSLVGTDGWDEASGPAETIGGGAFFEAVVGDQRCLVANRADDRARLGERGLMAAPVVTPDGAVLGALVVEAIPFTQLHLGAVASFRAVCAWVGAELEQAAAFEAAQDGRFLVDGSSLVAARHADRLVEIMAATARRIGFDLALMQVDLADDPAGTASAEARRGLVAVAEAVFRNTDILLEGGEGGQRLCVLMPGTPLRDMSLVAGRLRRAAGEQDAALPARLAISWLGLNQASSKALAA